MVMARDQSPQLAVLEQRGDYRRPHPHVVQVAAVHQRDAAQRGVGEVVGLRLARRVGRLDRHRLVVDVGQVAQPQQLEQAARRQRDVERRIVQAEQRRQVVCARFGHHGAAAVGSEAVGHHAIEAGQRAHVGDGGLQQLLYRGGTFQRGDEGIHVGVQQARIGRRRGGVDRLELQQQQTVDAMADHVIRAVGRPRGCGQSIKQQRLARPHGQAVQLRTQCLHRIAADDLVQRAAEQGVRLRRKHAGIGTALDDAQVRLAQREQQTVRLDCRAELDLLAVAVGQLICACCLQLHHRGRFFAAGSVSPPDSLRRKSACNCA